jgi:hypothetical protein
MEQFLKRLFNSDFMPHGACWQWEPWVVWSNVIPDALIALCSVFGAEGNGAIDGLKGHFQLEHGLSSPHTMEARSMGAHGISPCKGWVSSGEGQPLRRIPL